MEDRMLVDVFLRVQGVRISRARTLDIPGDVLVKIGDTVNPDDVIAQVIIPSQLRSLDIARGLGVDPSEVATYLIQDADTYLEAGEILAQLDGAITRLVRMPFAGRLIACQDGCAIIATDTVQIQKRAEWMGRITDIIPDFGAEISVEGDLVQGVWGNGHVGSGIMRFFESSLERESDLDWLADVDKDQILFLPECQDLDLLTRLLEKDIAGLIVASLSPGLIVFAQSLHIPVLVLQGFGDLHPDEANFQFLASSSGKMACVNAGKVDLLSGQRPEVIIPGEASQDQGETGSQAALSVGQQVQVHSGLSMGKIGRLVEIPDRWMTFESGISCQVAVVRLSEDETITVPRQNLSIIA